MTIEDLEMLLATYKNAKNKFQKIVEVLIQNKNDLIHFESVLKVLNDFEAVGNLHFINERDYFGKIMKNLELELKSF